MSRRNSYSLAAASTSQPRSGELLRQLARLPYDIQEDITEYLNRSDLCNLTLTNKYLSGLAARALYSDVRLHSSYRYPGEHTRTSEQLRPLDTLRSRQFSFLVAIAHHPEYANYIRHLAFEFTENDRHTAQSSWNHLVPTDLVWKAFAKCKAVTSIHIKMAKSHLHQTDDAGRIPKGLLFPNLRHAAVQGRVSALTLERVVNTSPRLRSLRLADGGHNEGIDCEVDLPPLSPNLSSFIASTVASKSFPALTALDIDACECVLTSASLEALFEHLAPHLRRLTVSFCSVCTRTRKQREGVKDAWELWDLDHTLCGFGWPELREIWLKGVALSSRRNALLRSNFPLLRDSYVDISEGKGSPPYPVILVDQE